MIPHKILSGADLCRSTPFNFKIADNNIVPNIILKNAKVALAEIFKKEKIIIEPFHLEIALADYYTVVLTIITMHAVLGEDDFDQADKVKNALGIFAADEETYNAANRRMVDILHCYGIYECDLTKKLIWFKHDIMPPTGYPDTLKNTIEIYSEITPNISL
ncbi:MAG: hypothetical protein U5K79_24070 [Cyclobacteriaceae bacterium]|nr:hypothetical protein [Cyclobacteriaceae bacterium]